MRFSCRQVRIEDEGRYLLLYCVFALHTFECPDPFKLEVIKHLLEFMADKTKVPVLIVGDFNMEINTQMHKFPLGKKLDQNPYMPLYKRFWGDGAQGHLA